MQSVIDEKKRRERSTPYPNTTLKTAVELAEELKKSAGKGPYSREFIAKALGHSSLTGPATAKIAALSHYGFLERNGSSYRICSNIEDFLNPVDEQQRLRALNSAAKAPALFLRFINEYNGSPLPQKLDALLLRDGVSSQAAQKVAEIFKETLDYAGMLVGGIVDASSGGVANTETTVQSEQVAMLPSGAPSNLVESRSTNIPTVQQFIGNHEFVDSGTGWSLRVRATKPLSASTKKLLIDVAEKLEAENQDTAVL